jgi:hypothetical protein
MKQLKALFAAICLLSAASGLRADEPGMHPGYLHALSDLRAAKWNIEHRPGDFRVSHEERKAVNEIWAAIKDIKAAAIDDGKNLDDHPVADETLDYHAHLHRALDLLRDARNDLAQEEDDPSVRGLRNRSVRHIDHAVGSIKKAIWAAENGG